MQKVMAHFNNRQSSRRWRLIPVLSPHRTYGSVYGGSIKLDVAIHIVEIKLFQPSATLVRVTEGFV